MVSDRLCAFNRIWRKVFIGVNVLTIIFMIGLLVVPWWVELKGLDVYIHGDLKGIKRGLHHEGHSYWGVAEEFCKERDTLEDEELDIQLVYEYYAAGCTLFTALSYSCIWFCAAEILSGISAIFTILLLSLSSNHIRSTFITVFLTVFFYCVGVTAYLAGAQVTFSGDCHEFNNGEQPGVLCAGLGVLFTLLLASYLVLSGLAYCAVGYLHTKQRRNEELHVQLERLGGPLSQTEEEQGELHKSYSP